MQFDKLDDNPKLIDVINKIHSEPWPRFLNESAIIKKYWRKLYKIFPRYQFLLKDNSEYIGLANTFPIYWNSEIDNLPTGFDESIETILQEPEAANTLCALAIVIKKKFSGKGLSSLILKYVKEAGRAYGFTDLIIPVRPTLKSKYPLIPMKNYMLWERSGLPFDPWLRVHVKNGGKILKEAYPSIVVRGSVAEWQEWTGLYFGDNGEYIIEGALNPVCIDLKNNFGEYVEPNVWVLHKTSTNS